MIAAARTSFVEKVVGIGAVVLGLAVLLTCIAVGEHLKSLSAELCAAQPEHAQALPA